MSEQIVLRLGYQPGQSISWLVWASHNNDVIASGEISSADQLPELAQRLGPRPATVLLPASEVILKEVTLPAKPNRQLLQALPYMLEEEQAEDVDQLFVALGALTQHDGQYRQQVALCKRPQIENWLTLLQQAGFNVGRMLPDALLLPTEVLPACIELNQQWLLRLDNWQATAVDQSWWQDYLGLAALPMLTSYSPWPQQILQPHQLAQPELPLALLVRQLPHTSFNLLQGPYTPKKQHNGLWRNGYLPAALLLACLVCYLLQQGLAGWQLSKQVAQVRQQTSVLYQQAFPDERIVNLNLQLRQKLASTSGSGEQQDFLALLGSLQQQLAAVPDIRLDNLRYDAKRTELRFQAKGDSFQSFERLKNTLEQQGFVVEQGALSNDGAKVQGSVGMRAKI